MKNFAKLLMLILMASSFQLDGCTGIKLVAKDGSIVHGRTLEFGIKVDVSVVFFPRNYDFTGATSDGPGLKYTSKYAAVGAISYDTLALMDGMNEKGLAVGTFYFPGFASYTKLTAENRDKALSPVDFTNWIVTQFATIDEVKAALSTIAVVPTVIKGWGDAPPPFHYIVYDKSGKSLVIEPIDGKLVTYDNPLGVFTNSPTFDWHITNLRNYINLTPFNVSPLKIDNIVFAPLGQNSGMVGLPGDFTPPSRFVRAAIFSITATPSDTAKEGVFQAFHLLNQFDIPVGIARQKEGDVAHTDYTLITAVRDPQSLKFFFKTYENQSIRMVDLNQFDLNAKTYKRLDVWKDSTQGVTDISSQLVGNSS